MRDILLIVLLIFCFSLYGQKIKTEYVNIYLGTYTKDTSILDKLHGPQMVNSYNKKGQLICKTLKGIGYFEKYIYNYNQKGKLINRTELDDYDIIRSNEKYTYNKQEKTLTKTFCDSLNNDCYTEEIIKYDKKGKIISSIYFFASTSNKKITQKVKINYDKNQIESKIMKQFEDDLLTVHMVHHFKNEKLVLTRDLIGNSFIKYTYYKNGREKTRVSNYGNGDITEYSYYEFDEYGNILLESWVNKSGYGEIKITSYEYY